ncbi:hypothetical protein OG292_19045 [Streptomyces sp. NBC_01511]|uniref:hypothetical protein n=1 Tax=Streptomyces sp. NBC_01511 TaxID=2903889 RepID=UPI00386CB489
MNARHVSAAADVICAAMRNGEALPLSWAAALESACLLQSPESAAELAQLKAQVAGLAPLQGADPVALTEAQVDALASAGNRAVNDAVHQDLCACDAWPENCLSSASYFQGAWDMAGLETALPAVIALWEGMRPDQAAEDVTGANLARWEEEQDTARLRLALKSAQRGRRRLRAQVAELEAQRDRRRGRLVALQNDALNMRGLLSPNGEARKVPFPLGNTLTPAVDWLIGRVAELESAAGCSSRITGSVGTTDCALPVRHRGDHRNAASDHFWDDEHADRVVPLVPAGALAEQAHLLDPLDHCFEVLPVRRSVPLSEMQRMSGDPLGDTPGGAK